MLFAAGEATSFTNSWLQKSCISWLIREPDLRVDRPLEQETPESDKDRQRSGNSPEYPLPHSRAHEPLTQQRDTGVIKQRRCTRSVRRFVENPKKFFLEPQAKSRRMQANEPTI